MNQRLPGKLIGLDWGTTSLRAYLFDGDGTVVDERSAPSGVMHLQRFAARGEQQGNTEALFEAAFEEICGSWLRDLPELPVIACGMVGSTVGWKEASYLPMPLRTCDLASALTKVPRKSGKPIYIVPGVSSAGIPGQRFPEIMRGEETQIAGILATGSGAGSSVTESLLIGLPGTHSKWAQIHGGQLTAFSTFVTGELFALLTTHSVVAKAQAKHSGFDLAGFQQGLQAARAGSKEAAGGILSSIFSTRAKRVLGELSEEQQFDYLSGLLIGEELRGVQRILERDQQSLGDFSRIILAGDRKLCERYQKACEWLEWYVPQFQESTVERGLWEVARAAGLAA